MFTQAVILLQNYLKLLGYSAQIHFELEGCFVSSAADAHIDLKKINRALALLSIEGEIVNEYWKNQWEYVSLFKGQSPLKEAENLAKVINFLPQLFAQHGIDKTLIQPVVWSGDQGKLATGSSDIFTTDTRSVHIPNAIQINVSVLNQQGVNIIAQDNFGEYLQQCFLKTSKACSLLYLPEEEAFARFKLKSHYGLAQELCSPYDISGGHQGSVALYKELGKHNQRMGEEPLLFDQYQNTLLSHHNWQKTARIEHRLGASSVAYNPYANVLFALANVIDAVEAYNKENRLAKLLVNYQPTALPESLYSRYQQSKKIPGAIELFLESDWFSERINKVQDYMATEKNVAPDIEYLGDAIKRVILANYQHKQIQLPVDFNRTNHNKMMSL